jgi:hypothetical protein
MMLDGDHLIAVNPPPVDEVEYLHSAISLLVAHQRHFGHRHFVISVSGLAPDERTLPDSKQKCLQPCEVAGSQLGFPFGFDVAQDVVDRGVCRPPAGGEAHDPCAPLRVVVGAREIPERFEAPKQLVHSLFAHSGTVCQLAWTHTVRSGVLQHRDVG